MSKRNNCLACQGLWLWLSRIVVAVACVASLQPTLVIGAPPCSLPSTILIGHRDGIAAAIDPVGERVALPLLHSDDGFRWWARQASEQPAPSRWHVTREATDTTVTLAIADVVTSEVLVSQTFGKRIELAASTVSPGHRFAVYLQGNNIASEVTVLDARQETRRMVRLPHHADLAPFAIGFAFSPGETCLAVALERVGGSGPELWIVPLAGGEARFVDPQGLWIEQWRAGSG